MISIIIPTYNEAKNIKPLIRQICLALKHQSYEIIVVDDNSPDKTWALVKKLQQKNKSIKLIHRLKQKGLTSAINQGIQQSKGSLVGWLDADLSHPPHLLKTMLKQLNQFDAVIASRYIKNAQDKRGIFIAVLFSRLINLLAQLLLYKNITDYTSGYILVKRRYLENIPLKGDYGEYFIDLLFNLKQAKASLKEIPYISQNRVHGQSKTATNLIGFINRGWKYLYTIFYLWLKKLFSA